ncbi:hypothetical protein Acr_00g0044680 [Actinidia rufa]|uniref:Uncharacterized protein n=1 Tax=Actinidia rufa TaxID=165716 RepID=A0A7J0DJE1_9ERIC|nr:hypothetical protein Acr_00g0044680 [Actinidia rufa]
MQAKPKLLISEPKLGVDATTDNQHPGAKGIDITELHLPSRFGVLTALKLGRRTTVDSIIKGMSGDRRCPTLQSPPEGSHIRVKSEDVNRMMTGYQLGRRGMDGSAAYSLTQRTTRMSACQHAICRSPRQLARQGTRRAGL